MIGSSGKTLGDLLYEDLEKNTYLNEIYGNLMYDYAVKKFGLKLQAKQTHLKDALKFSDILSKSSHNKNSEKNVLTSQEMVLLLNYIYDIRPAGVDFYKGLVLQHIGNYQGLKTLQSSAEYSGVLDMFYEDSKMESLRIGNQDKFYMPVQKTIVDSFDHKCIAFSGPTSLGKSFMMNTYIKNKISNGEKGNFVIIVPTRALITQTRDGFISELKETLSENDYVVVTSSNDIALQDITKNFIFIMTPERVTNLIKLNIIDTFDYVFIDEAHKLAPRDKRSLFYYQVIGQLAMLDTTKHFIFASPNVINPDTFFDFFPMITDKKAIKTEFSPVCQFKFIIDIKNKSLYYFNNLSKELYGLITYKNLVSTNKWIKHIGRNTKNLIYCSTPNKAIKFAESFGSSVTDLNDGYLNKLSDIIAMEIHPKCKLVSLIKKGICYHVGYLPQTVRVLIEDAFKDKNCNLHYMFCTSTLIEGVNMPATNLFVTSTYKNKALSDLDFKNLIGRPGRLLENLYGNVFLICTETSYHTQKDTYESYLTRKPKPLKLEIHKDLTDNEKEMLKTHLKNGDLDLKDIREGLEPETYELYRSYILTLANEVKKDGDGLILGEIKEWVDENKEDIKANTSFDKLCDDINISPSQIEALDTAISNGSYYPELTDDDETNLQITYDFLMELSTIFDWKAFERKSIQCSEENFKRYSLILYYWIKGESISSIIDKDLEFEKTQISYLYVEKWITNPSTGKKELTPVVSTLEEYTTYQIKKVLNIINSTILNTFSNYLKQYSETYLEAHGGIIDNNWYDYVEYGSVDSYAKMLQQYGFSRSSSLIMINDYTKYLHLDLDGVKVKQITLSDDNPFLKSEANIIHYNLPEIFE